MKIKKSQILKLNESIKKWIRLTEGKDINKEKSNIKYMSSVDKVPNIINFDNPDRLSKDLKSMLQYLNDMYKSGEMPKETYIDFCKGLAKQYEKDMKSFKSDKKKNKK